jgi:DNA polymerase III delta prime subunit
MAGPPGEFPSLLRRSLEGNRLHSAYLLSGPGPTPREAALAFVRAAVCLGDTPKPCEGCAECRRSQLREEIVLDGTGKRGPLLRHVGDHPDLLWVERGPDDTRVRIGQIRALQHALRLRGAGAGHRAAVIADAEWLNVEAQNALLRLLEEPPPRTTLVVVASSSAGLLATLRSRCQRVTFAEPPARPLDDPERQGLVERFEALPRSDLAQLLDWAEEYRGARAPAAEGVRELLDTGAAWLRARVGRAVARPGHTVEGELDAWKTLSACRRSLDQRNANPQMVAERALMALHAAVTA